jgi:hypothetical protein
MSPSSNLFSGVRLPFDPALRIPPLRHVAVDQPDTPVVADVQTSAYVAVLAKFTGMVEAGDIIAVGAGSRGLTARVEMLRGTLRALIELGAEPFVVPAMGSHGGATADGQRELLSDYGITEESVGVPIHATMETEVVARTADGMPLYLDAFAAKARYIFPVNRVKPHTCFTGPIESGLTKMAVVGFGKQPGAAQIHACGPTVMRDRLLAGIDALKQTGRVLGGLCTVESPSGEIVRVTALDRSEIGGQAERDLTAFAKGLVPRLPVENIDVLIVDEMGKTISGVGMDPNVTGRFWVHGYEGNSTIATIVMLGLNDDSHGNALGIGLADFTTIDVFNRIDWQNTYVNSFTAGPSGVRRSRLPMVLPTDDDAIKAALSMCGRAVNEDKRVVRIRSTLHLTEMWVSDAVIADLPPHCRLS